MRFVRVPLHNRYSHKWSQWLGNAVDRADMEYVEIPDNHDSAMYRPKPMLVENLINTTGQLHKLFNSIRNGFFQDGDVIFIDNSRFVGLDYFIMALESMGLDIKVIVYSIGANGIYNQKYSPITYNLFAANTTSTYDDKCVGIPWNTYQVQNETYAFNHAKKRHGVTYVTELVNTEEQVNRGIVQIKDLVANIDDQSLSFNVLVGNGSYENLMIKRLYDEVFSLRKNISGDCGNAFFSLHTINAVTSKVMLYDSPMTNIYNILECYTLGAHPIMVNGATYMSLFNDYEHASKTVKYKSNSSFTKKGLADTIQRMLNIDFDPVNDRSADWYNGSADRIAHFAKNISTKQPTL